MSTLKPSAEELAGADFRKSSYSGGGGNECVELADLRTWTCLRDSKREDGPTVIVSRAAFDQVLAAVSNGTL